jgi:hypothetical protein
VLLDRISALTAFCAFAMRALSAGFIVRSLGAFFCFVSTFVSCFSCFVASRVVSWPLCKPCSMRCCWLTSRWTVVAVSWASAPPEISAPMASARAVWGIRMASPPRFVATRVRSRFRGAVLSPTPDSGPEMTRML